MVIVYDNTALLPAEWRRAAADGLTRTFNPALLRDREGWLFAYRVVAEPEMRRRIAVCRLDENFRVRSDSAIPFSDWIKFRDPEKYAAPAYEWFADPRLYRLQGRLFIYWNSGWHEPSNYQFLQEIDSSSLRPVGEPREMILQGTRQKLEKNWTLFEADGLHAVYSVNPHRVLTFSLEGSGPIEFREQGTAVRNDGGFAQLHGGLRGGAPPQRLGGHFYSFCHSIENGDDGYRYVASAYRFLAASPFRPTDMPTRPLQIQIPTEGRRALPKLNPAVGDVLYPAGAAWCGDRWAVSLGIDDEHCGVAMFTEFEVAASLSAQA